jgi:hypothetical protein
VISMKPDRRKYADKLISPSMSEDSSELAEKSIQFLSLHSNQNIHPSFAYSRFLIFGSRNSVVLAILSTQLSPYIGFLIHKISREAFLIS